MAMDNGVLHVVEGFAQGILPDAQLYRRCLLSAHNRLKETKVAHPQLDLSLGQDLITRLEDLGSGACFTRYVFPKSKTAQPASQNKAKHNENTPDQQVLQELLELNHPAADARVFSMALLAEYGNIDGVINAPDNRLKMIAGVDERLIRLMHLLRAIRTRAILEQTTGNKAIRSSQDIFDYCVSAMAHLDTAQVRVMYIDRHKALIGVEVVQNGDFSTVAFFAREILHRATELSARYIVVIQNQPHGAEEPDFRNLFEIFKIAKSGEGIGVGLVDYVLVSPDMCFSFNEMSRVDDDRRIKLDFEYHHPITADQEQ